MLFFPTSLCGVLVFGSASRPPPPPPAPVAHNLLTHNLHTHNLLTHNLLTHTTCSHTHTTCSHKTCTHTHNLLTTQLAHTHNCCRYCTAKTSSNMQISTSVATIVLQNIWKFLTHTQLTHTQLAHTQLTHTQLPHTTSIVTLRGRRGTYGTGLALAARLVSHGAVTPRRFAWQAWHFVTPAFNLCGRRGRVALDDIDCYFAWQAWHLWHWVGSGGALGQPWHRDAAAFCVAGVALRDICLHFEWQAWHFVTSAFTLCGRRGSRGTWRHPPSFHMAGVALRDIYLVITPLVFTLLVRTQLVFTLLVHTQLAHLSSHHLCLHTTCLHTTCPPGDKKKDHVHDRSEQFLRNRLPLFLCCLLSVGATLLHLPPSLGRSTTLRCRDLC